MTKKASSVHLTRRERQIMDVLYQMQRAAAEEIRERLPDPPSNSSVRTMLRILEEKGHIHHEQDGARFVFVPTIKPDKAKRSAMRHLVDTFFGGSGKDAIAALFDISVQDLGDEELADLRRLIARAARERSDRP
jgi:BlaI family penicillinase repressor